MSHILVKLADIAVSNSPEDVLMVFGLGSTAAVLLHDMESKTGGIVHFMLPDSTSDPGRSSEYPAMFANSGIPLLLKECLQKGARKEALTAKLVGGSYLLGKGLSRTISDGNVAAAKKIMKGLGIPISAEDTGGNHNRAVRLDIASGKTSLKRPDGTWEVWT